MNKLSDDFLNLARIASPSGEEAEVANYILQRCRKLGLKCSVDSSGRLNASNTGNVSATVPGNNIYQKILFVAHMDTVQQPGQRVEPKFINGSYYSDGTTILGADNKAGVAILLSLAFYLINQSDKPAVHFLFTTREENGEMGSSLLKKTDADLIINVDGSNTVGTVDVAGLGQRVFKLTVHGKASHAAKFPEKGVNAIVIASRIISRIKVGKYYNGDTCNIGSIEGGGATNIVPDRVTMCGEIRSFSQAGLERRWEKLGKLIKKWAQKYNARYDLVINHKSSVRPFETIRSKKLENLLIKAGRAISVRVCFEKMSATSDASFLSRFDKPVMCLNHGGKNPHSLRESISLFEMEQTLTILTQFIKLIMQESR